VSTLADLLGLKAASPVSGGRLEALKKLYNQSRRIDRQMLRKAFENASHPRSLYRSRTQTPIERRN